MAAKATAWRVSDIEEEIEMKMAYVYRIKRNGSMKMKESNVFPQSEKINTSGEKQQAT
jgi:hypothetical protein